MYDVTLGRDWFDQMKGSAIRVISVTKPEVVSATANLVDDRAAPSAVLMIGVPGFKDHGTSIVTGKLGMKPESPPEIAKQHCENLTENEETIWAAPRVLNSTWAACVIIRQQEIKALTMEVNEWAIMQGSKLAKLLTRNPSSDSYPLQPDSVDQILSKAAKDPDLSNKLRHRIVKFYAGLAEQARILRKYVTALKKDMRSGIGYGDYANNLNKTGVLSIIDPGYPGPMDALFREGKRLTDSNNTAMEPNGRSDDQGSIRQDNKDESGCLNTSKTPLTAAGLETRHRNSSDSIGEPNLSQGEYGSTNTDSTEPDDAPDVSDRDRDLDLEVYFKENELPTIPTIIAAPTASNHFFIALEEVETHWLQLAQFEALVKARKIQLEIVGTEYRLASDNERDWAAANTMERGRETRAKVPVSTDTKASEISTPDRQIEIEVTKRSGIDQERTDAATNEPEKLCSSSPDELAPCILCPRSFGNGHAERLTALEQAQVQSNLETRRRASLSTSSTTRNTVNSNDGDSQAPIIREQTIPDPMSENPSGGAASTRPPPAVSKDQLVSSDLDGKKVDSFYESAYWVPGGEQRPEGIWLEPLVNVARSVTRSPFTKEGALYEPVFRTIKTGEHTTGEIVVHSLADSSKFGLSLGDRPAKKSLVFGATLLDRSFRMGHVGNYEFGFLVIFGSPMDGIRASTNKCSSDESSQNSGQLISPRNPLYPKLQDCLLKRVVDEDEDVFLGLSASVDLPQPVHAQDPGSTESSSLVQGPADAQSIPKVEVVTDVVRLHHLTKPFEKRQRRLLRQDAALMIREYQEKAIGRVTVCPGPNHMPHLVAELVRLTVMVSEASQRQTHRRQSMRANPDALRYATQHLTPSEAEAFACLAAVQVHLHGIDALQDFRERLRVTRPLAHLDLLIRLTMEIIDEKMVIAPNYMEREFQKCCEYLFRLEPMIQIDWAWLGYRPKNETCLRRAPAGSTLQIDPLLRRQVHSLHVVNFHQIEFRPKSTLPSPTPGKVHADDILALLPAGTVIVEKASSRRENADETIMEEWGASSKIVQRHLSAQATPTMLSPGYHPTITRYNPYCFDESLLFEPRADRDNVLHQSSFPQQIERRTAAARPADLRAGAESLIQPVTVILNEHNAISEDSGATNAVNHAQSNVRTSTASSGIIIDHSKPLSPRKTRANSSPEPPSQSFETARREEVQHQRYRRLNDPPTTPYLDARRDEELEEGEISELEYLDEGEDELQYPENSEYSINKELPRLTWCFTVSSEESDRLPVQNGTAFVPGKPSATVRKAVPSLSVNIPDFTAAPRSKETKLELVYARASSPEIIPIEFPAIWQTMPALRLPSHHQAPPVVMVNTVLAGDASNVPQPPKSPLPLLKRKASQVDRPEPHSSSSTGTSMVLGASVASNLGSSNHSVRSAPGRFVPMTQFTGVLDFQLAETKRRNFSNSLTSVKSEPSTQSTSHLLQIALPDKGSEKTDCETYQRPIKSLGIVDEDGYGKEGEEMSEGESIEEREMEEQIDETSDEEFMREFFYIDDWRSWLADKDIAADLVSHSSQSPECSVGTIGTEPASSDATDDDMDTESDSYSGQESETVPINRERNRPRTPFNLANPDQQLSPALLEATDFVHQPSAVRDPLGYHDHSQTVTRNITNPSPEAIVEQYNPDQLPGPGHPLSGNGRVRKIIDFELGRPPI
ncbi:hypothetical protein C8J56DRAFT_881185 [Mycena floridula]|nr:hypothetical protein C8J56DRAFT_881185 [Mycena floridula]